MYCNSGTKIISYANIRISNGSVYKQLGFTEIGKSDPNYCYIKQNKIYSRYQCQKHKLKNLLGSEFDKNLTEKENMIKSGYRILYDCGNYIYEFIS